MPRRSLFSRCCSFTLVLVFLALPSCRAAGRSLASGGGWLNNSSSQGIDLIAVASLSAEKSREARYRSSQRAELPGGVLGAYRKRHTLHRVVPCLRRQPALLPERVTSRVPACLLSRETRREREREGEELLRLPGTCARQSAR